MMLNGKQSQTLNTLQRVIEELGGEVAENGELETEAGSEASFEVRANGKHLFFMSIDHGGRAASHP